jgi:DNA-binding XRE family transcriptional regulator
MSRSGTIAVPSDVAEPIRARQSGLVKISGVRDNRAGMMLRVVRRRCRLTQAELAARAGVSQQTVSVLERGHFDGATLRLIKQVVAPLGVTVGLVLGWKGPELDRLVDARHARLVQAVVSRLGSDWRPVVEYSFNHYGDRGSVDVMAWHAGARALLLVEVKSELVGLEALMRSMDVKVRVVPGAIARERGWHANSVGSVLVLPDEATARRAVDRMAPVFGVALPARTVAVRRWLREPSGPVRGIWFLADTPNRRAVRNPGGVGRVCHPRSSPGHAQDEVASTQSGPFDGRSVEQSASNTPGRRR